MKTLRFLFAFVLLTVSLIAQNGPIPQDLPRDLRQDAVRRGVEQPIPPFPFHQPTINTGLPTSLRATNKQTTQGRVNAGSVEDRIAALQAKVAALEAEIETQRAMIKQLQDRLDRQERK